MMSVVTLPPSSDHRRSPPGPSSAALSSLSSSAPWTGWLVALMAGIVALYTIDILAAPVSPSVSELFQKFAGAAIFFGAAPLCVLRGMASSHKERSAWWLFAVAMLLWGTASVYYAIFLWDSQPVPVPSVADGLWLAFYVPAYAALYKLLRARAGS